MDIVLLNCLEDLPTSRRLNNVDFCALRGNTNYDDQNEWEVEYIVARRTTYLGWEYLLHWKGYSEEYNSWEPWKNLQNAKELRDAFDQKMLSAKLERAKP